MESQEMPNEEKSEVQQLREEIAALTKEMKLLKKMLFLKEDQDLEAFEKPTVFLDAIYCHEIHVTSVETEAEIKIECDDAARIVLFAPEQQGYVTIDSGNGKREGASIGLFNKECRRRASLQITKDDGGALSLWHKGAAIEKRGKVGEPFPGGSFRVHLEAGSEGGQLSLYGDNEKTRIQAQAKADGGVFMLCYPDNKSAVALVSHKDGAQAVLNTPDHKSAGGIISSKMGGELMIMNSQGIQKVCVATQNEQGIVSLLGQDQNPRAALAVRPDDNGVVAVYGPDGDRRASMSAYEDGGAVEVSVGGSESQAALQCDENGGMMRTATADGVPLFAIAPISAPDEGDEESSRALGAQFLLHRGDGVPAVLAGPGPMFSVLGHDGQPKIMMLGEQRGGRLDVLSQSGSTRVTLDVDNAGSGLLNLFNDNGKAGVICAAHDDGGIVQICNETGQPQAALSPGSDGGRMHLYRQDGELGATAAAHEEGGALEFYDGQGHSRAVLP